MKNTIFVLFALSSSCATITKSNLTTASDAGIVADIPLNDFDQIHSAKHDRLTILEIGAPWCEPCKMMKPELTKLAKDKQGTYQIIVDIGDQMDFLKKHRIYGLPTWYVYLPNRPDPVRVEGTHIEKIKLLALSYPNTDQRLIDELSSTVATESPKSTKKKKTN